MAARFAVFLKFYQVILFVVAKPTALLLNWWLGPETIALFRERDFRILMSKHLETVNTDLGKVEALGAVNFLDLDDISVLDEGEQVDSRSIVSLPVAAGRPVLPKFERTATDPFLRQLDASGPKWVIFVDQNHSPHVAERQNALVAEGHKVIADGSEPLTAAGIPFDSKCITTFDKRIYDLIDEEANRWPDCDRHPRAPRDPAAIPR